MASAAEIAWAAGLFEGEGTFNMARPSGAYFQMSITSTDKDVIERFAQIAGIGSVRPQKMQKSHTKPTWRWCAGGRAAIPFLDEIYPWLGKRRRARADDVLGRYANAA